MTKAKTKPIKQEEKTAVKSAAAATTNSKKSSSSPPEVSFEIKELHQKALLVLFRCYHNEQTLTYAELSAEVGKGEKTKAWQCEAWKDLKSNGFIVSAAEAKHFQLSPQGVELAKTFASEEELAEYMIPATNEEHHEKIRNRLLRYDNKGKTYGPKIFDLMLELSSSDNATPVTRGYLARKLSTNPDAHGFFYGFKNLQKMGMVDEAGSLSKSEMKKIKTEDAKEEEEENEDKDDMKDDSDDAEKKIKKEGDDDHEENDMKDIKVGTNDGEANNDKKKKKKKKSKCTRNRGGYKLFKLSSKAFLATASTKASD